MPEQSLEGGHWRAFRLFLNSLAGEELDRVCEELAKELAARQDCETVKGLQDTQSIRLRLIPKSGEALVHSALTWRALLIAISADELARQLLALTLCFSCEAD